MTELSCVAAVARFDDPGPAGSVGRLVANTELQVVDPASGRPLPADEVGELWIRGSQVMAGYRHEPDVTAATVDAEGWLHTGDLGRVDAQGYVHVVDRIKDLIKVKGYEVAPAELEELLLEHPSVRDVAVGPAELDGDQRSVAYVVPAEADTFDADALSGLADLPGGTLQGAPAVHLVEAVPRNPNGKVLRRSLAPPSAERPADGTSDRR